MKCVLLLVTLVSSFLSYGQRYDKSENRLGEPILTDSASTLFIPVTYDEALLSSNKIAAWGGVLCKPDCV